MKLLLCMCATTKYSGTSLWDKPLFCQGTPPFSGHKIILSLKNVHIIFVPITPIEGTPLFRGKRHSFRVSKPGFNLLSVDNLALKKWLTTKIVDKFNHKDGLPHLNQSGGDVLHLWDWDAEFCRDKLNMIFYALSCCYKYWPQKIPRQTKRKIFYL